jgi:hypothetical protein
LSKPEDRKIGEVTVSQRNMFAECQASHALSDFTNKTRNSKGYNKVTRWRRFVSGIGSSYPEIFSVLRLPSLFDIGPINTFRVLCQYKISMITLETECLSDRNCSLFSSA